METAQQPSTFAQIIDKLRDKSEEELKLLYTQLLMNDMTAEAQTVLAEKFEGYNSNKNTKGEQTSGKQNSIDDVFGIWKDKNVTLDSIREEAWQRTK